MKLFGITLHGPNIFHIHQKKKALSIYQEHPQSECLYNFLDVCRHVPNIYFATSSPMYVVQLLWKPVSEVAL